MGSPATILSTAAASRPAKPALVFGETVLSYAELEDRTRRVAGALRERGIAPGDRVSIYAQNRWEWVVAYHGSLQGGRRRQPGQRHAHARGAGVRAATTAAPRRSSRRPSKARRLLELAAATCPSLRHVVSFGERSVRRRSRSATCWQPRAAAREIVRRARTRSARSATHRARPATRRAPCRPTGRCCSTAR